MNTSGGSFAPIPVELRMSANSTVSSFCSPPRRSSSGSRATCSTRAGLR